MYRKALKTPSGENLHGSELKPSRSILKKTESPSSSKDVASNAKKSCVSVSGSVRSVKFIKSKSVQQARLRSKLNSWLDDKGKTPSRYFNLMYFDEQLSAKKKRDKSLPGKLSKDLLGKQVESLKNEDLTARKELFKGCSKTSAKVPIRKSTSTIRRNSSGNSITNQSASLKKENTPTSRRSFHHQRSSSRGVETKPFNDKSNGPLRSPHHSSSQKQRETVLLSESVNASSSSDKELSQEPPITDDDIRENLVHMLQECLTLYRAGCPSEHILSWLENMEEHIPQTHTCALFYACKAEVFTSNPVKMLAVFCQGVENKAEPSHVLTDAMKQLLTPHFPQPQDETTGTSTSHHSQACNATATASQNEMHEVGMDDGDLDFTDNAHCHPDDDGMPFQSRFSAEIVTIGSSNCQTTPLKDNCSHSPSLSSFDVGFNSGNKRRSVKHTPTTVKESHPVPGSTAQLGSAIKYTVSVASPIPGQSPESVPKLLVTPVRRSTRLSNRLPTPQAQREIDSVLDLTLKEAESTMFSSNPAIEDC